MKNILMAQMVLLAALTLIFQFSCQEEMVKQSIADSQKKLTSEAATESAVTDEGKPQIEFENTVHDFGDIGKGTRHACNFKFTNTGTGVLKISKTTKTCGCTPFKLAKKEYAPGESGKLKVEYHAGSHPGKVEKHLYVFSNAEKNKKVQLTIKAKIVEKVSHEPRTLKLTLSEDNTGCPPIKITSIDGKVFSIKSFKATGDCMTAEFNPSKEAAEFTLEPKVDFEKLRKNMDGRIELRLTHPECSRIEIPFKTLREFAVNPPSITIIKPKPGKPARRELWVLNNYEKEFEIESTSSRKGLVKVTNQEKNGNRYKLDIEIMPPEKTKKSKLFKDDLYIDIKDGEQLKVPCRGFY